MRDGRVLVAHKDQPPVIITITTGNRVIVDTLTFTESEITVGVGKAD